MKPLKFIPSIVILLLTVGSPMAVPFAENTHPPGPPARDDLHAPGRTLSPAERQARIQQAREARGGPALPLPELTAGEFAAKRREIRDRFQTQLTDLRQRKTTNALTRAEQRRLEQMEELAPHFEHAAGITNRQFFSETSRRDEVLKRLADLRRKKADATISDEEQRQLERMEEVGRRMEQNGFAGGRPPGDPHRKDEIQRRLTELREKRSGGTITDQEQRQLNRMEEIEKRIREGGPLPGIPPAQRPGAPE